MLASPSVEVEEVETSVARYEEAFHNFVCSHDNYLLYEDDEEKKELMLDSYNNQRDMKLQLDILVNNWRAKKKGMNRPPSESGFSLKSARTDKSCASRNSVKEKKRVIEETKLEMQALQEKQELQRRIEEIERGKAELSRKLELLDAKTKVKHAEIDLFVEQSVEYEGGDRMNDYLKEHYVHDLPLEDHLLQPDVKGATPISKSHPVESHGAISTSFVTPTSAQPQLPLLSTQETVKSPHQLSPSPQHLIWLQQLAVGHVQMIWLMRDHHVVMRIM